MHNPCRRSAHPATPSSMTPTSPVDATFAPSFLSENRIILLYPGRPSRCPLQHCSEGFTTFDTLTGAMTSIHRHLHESHLIKADKFWRCSICGLEDTGLRMNGHYKRCLRIQNAPISEPQPSSRSESSTPLSPRTTVTHETRLTTTPPQLPGPDPEALPAPSRPQPQVQSPSSPPTRSVSIQSMEDHLDESPEPLLQRHQQPYILAPPPTTRMTYDASDHLSPSPSTNLAQALANEDLPQSAFFHLWADAVSNCGSIEELDSVIKRCSEDWLLKASRPQQDQPNREGSESPPSEASQGVRRPARSQSRQQQRARRNRKFNAHEASRLQRLYRTYPRQAVRRILGEKSPNFTGQIEEATAHFNASLHCPMYPTGNQAQSKVLLDACCWPLPDDDQVMLLSSPPTEKEIQLKLSRASNTSPGPDGLEYRHLKALDPNGRLLARIYSQVWALGIPDAWKSSKTILIHKKGDTADINNFRPISLLSTLYKIFSGIISQRLAAVAVDLHWISPEQKGFLPGVRGIQEHTQLLQAAVEEAKSKKKNLSITWLDISNAFGSIPHQVIFDLFDSLPLPPPLRVRLKDIYQNNIMNIMIGKESIPTAPVAGVRQGDPLSTTVFNLVIEPLIREIKSAQNPGFKLFGTIVKTTAYADDLSIVSPTANQSLIDKLVGTASQLGMRFNGRKCSNLSFVLGKVSGQPLKIDSNDLRRLGADDVETYLGVPIGAKLLFRPPTTLIPLLDKIRDSLLAPYQKLEVYRAHLLPSLCHHLASGRCNKETLEALDGECKKFLKAITDLPTQAADAFFYADRSLGGLGTFRLIDEADIWTVARATQLLTSNDSTVSSIFREQLKDTIMRCFSLEAPDPLPLGPYLSGSSEDGLYRLRFAQAGLNLWTLARRAAKRLGARIDVSSEFDIQIIADDISVRPLKAVRGLRTAVRQQWSRKFLNLPHQGRVAQGLALEASEDMAKTLSCRTELRIADWTAMHRARLDILPLRGYPWSSDPTKACRRCGQSPENGFHVLNHCRVSLPLKTKRHNNVQDILVSLLLKSGIKPTTNRAPPGQRLIPDVHFSIAGTRVVIDITIPYDTPENLDAAHNRKTEKYSPMGKVLPLVVGSLGSWHPRNNDIRSLLRIDGRSWTSFRRACRISAISGSMDIIRSHVRPSEPADQTPVVV